MVLAGLGWDSEMGTERVGKVDLCVCVCVGVVWETTSQWITFVVVVVIEEDHYFGVCLVCYVLFVQKTSRNSHLRRCFRVMQMNQHRGYTICFESIQLHLVSAMTITFALVNNKHSRASLWDDTIFQNDQGLKPRVSARND